jgi:hypothetical protein
MTVTSTGAVTIVGYLLGSSTPPRRCQLLDWGSRLRSRNGANQEGQGERQLSNRRAVPALDRLPKCEQTLATLVSDQTGDSLALPVKRFRKFELNATRKHRWLF